MTLSTLAGTRDPQWRKIDEALKQGLPQTAVTNLEPIIQGALKDKAFGEATKAIGLRIILLGNIQGNKPEEKILLLQKEIAKAPKEMTPMLQAVLAHWYWQYFQQNRWRYLQRTQTSEPPGNDFTTWDLARLFLEIDKQFQSALAAENFLKSTPVNSWNDLLVKGSLPDSYRPTLFDFISHEALSFYTSGEQAGAKPEDATELTTDVPYSGSVPLLGSAEEFTRAKLERAANQSSAEKALFIFRNLILFHLGDKDPTALANVDLERLAWVQNVAVGADVKERYMRALRQFVERWPDHEISALALSYWATELQQAGDLVEAHRLAEQGARAFPNAPGGKLCHNAQIGIESKSVQLVTERIWNAPWPNIEVTYRNIEELHFRAIPYDWATFLEKRHNRPQNLTQEEKREVLQRKAVREWSEKLPRTADYKEKTISFVAPDKLEPGFYFIAASSDPAFREQDNVVFLTDVWVSDLALITRTRNGALEGFVLEANSGEPMVGAEVSIWHLDNQGNRTSDPSLKTDENGFWSATLSPNRGYLVRARHHGQEIANADDLWTYNRQNQEPRPTAQSVLFTDRALYRPGQLIQYKGICIWVDQAKDNYEPLKAETVTVVFRDVNGKEIGRQTRQANVYGSFAGSFTAPRDRLTGQMRLEIEGRARGTSFVRIEEYKRPKFEVTLDTPKSQVKLNEQVTLDGHAQSYTGAAVDRAQVTYRVVRETHMPWWWGWFRTSWRPSESQEIAHGTATTEIDGTFKIQFNALPDRKIPESDEPTFTFQVHADVTDSSGETRSADRDVRLGYAAIEATLSAEPWQTEDTPVNLKVAIRTLNDDPQAAEGRIRIYELQPPATVHRRSLNPLGVRSETESNVDPSEPNHWPLGKVVDERGFNADTNGSVNVAFALVPGAYRAVLETVDASGKKVSARLPLQVIRPGDSRLPIKIPSLVTAPQWTAQPGEEFMAVWGTGYDTGRAFIEIEHRHRILQRFWTQPGRTQQQVRLAVTEAMRGGFTLHVTQVRENRGYLDSRRIEVPWTNKELEIKWEHFTTKLHPGQKETWTAVIQPATGAGSTNSPERKAAEMVATLYDESLDAFAPHSWMENFRFFRVDNSSMQKVFANVPQNFMGALGHWSQSLEEVRLTYRSFPPELTANLWGFAFPRAALAISKGRGEWLQKASGEADSIVNSRMASPVAAMESLAAAAPQASRMETGNPPPDASRKVDLSQVSARKNLNETAFFYPQLTSDSNGIVRMTFTMPEALTKWHFYGFAHDTQLRSGYLEGHAVTAKELMVQPNPPRFLREKDTVEFTVKVSNQTDTNQTGKVRLTWTDALNDTSVDSLLGNIHPEQTFSIPGRQSRSFSWRITVPEACGYLSYKAVGATEQFSDGEEGAVPVLSSRILITESLPLPIRGPATKKFEFLSLAKTAASKSIQNQSLTLQMVSHPAWYAVLALPYLMEFPYECSEQTFNRFYANSLARRVANANPKIRRTFDLWKNTSALESPLEKNQDLKSVALEETPWLQQAESETQARHNLGILFDENRLETEAAAMLEKLNAAQQPDGLWPWFPGGPGNTYISLYIATGFGRLRNLGAQVDVGPALRSLARLDSHMNEQYTQIRKQSQPGEYVLSGTDALYLYGRSFFLKDSPIAPVNKVAFDFYLNQARKYWLKTNSRQTQGHLALALYHFAKSTGVNDPVPVSILKSLKERSVTSEELGTFWRDTELSWWWYHAPIETQALMIEAFDEIANDQPTVENCKAWLLKQKQTQDWKTTKATADAIYALLLRGADFLGNNSPVEVKLDGIDVTPSTTPAPLQESGSKKTSGSTKEQTAHLEPGTGFYEKRFSAHEIKPGLAKITVKKSDPGVAWGSVHWQYLQDIARVTPTKNNPLQLKKTLYVKTLTARGPELKPVTGTLEVGNELVVRIELRADRDMEFIHLKDQRGSGTEPSNVLSSYKYQDGLAYYESTRDTASHFFIDYLPKGVYVFEYSIRVQLRGNYQSGISEIQCMYAPEFNAHSESFELIVK